MLARTIALFALVLLVTACTPKPKPVPAAAMTDDTMQMLKETFGAANVGKVAAVGKDNLVAVIGLPIEGWSQAEVVTFMDGKQQTVAQGTFHQISQGFPIIKLNDGDKAPAVGMAAVRITGATTMPTTVPATTPAK